MSWSSIFNISLLQNTLRVATPVVLAAMGGLMTEQAGIMNIGMDGMILFGAFVAVVFSYLYTSATIGVLAAIVVGILIGLLFALYVVKFRSDEFIIGMALNTFSAGLTVYLLRTIFGVKGTFSDAGIVPIMTVNIPFLEKIPILGDVLNGNSLLVYISWLVVLLAWLFLYRTPYGFWLRASGEHPESLETCGVNPRKMKVIASVICGVCCGLAGAHLSLGNLTMFTEGMNADRGFIAFACVMFGMANPPKVFVAALLFGFFQALGLRLQNVGIPSDLTQIIPYFATILMLIYIAATKMTKKRGRRKDN